MNNKTVLLHRFITDAPKGMLVDHIDGNGLNCQKSNLRICTPSENKTNTKRFSRSGRHSNYRGVVRANSKWRAQIKKNGIQMSLGQFDTAEEAAIAYDTKALELYDEFAVLNFPDRVRRVMFD